MGPSQQTASSQSSAYTTSDSENLQNHFAHFAKETVPLEDGNEEMTPKLMAMNAKMDGTNAEKHQPLPSSKDDDVASLLLEAHDQQRDPTLIGLPDPAHSHLTAHQEAQIQAAFFERPMAMPSSSLPLAKNAYSRPGTPSTANIRTRPGPYPSPNPDHAKLTKQRRDAVAARTDGSDNLDIPEFLVQAVSQPADHHVKVHLNMHNSQPKPSQKSLPKRKPTPSKSDAQQELGIKHIPARPKSLAGQDTNQVSPNLPENLNKSIKASGADVVQVNRPGVVRMDFLQDLNVDSLRIGSWLRNAILINGHPQLRLQFDKASRLFTWTTWEDEHAYRLIIPFDTVIRIAPLSEHVLEFKLSRLPLFSRCTLRHPDPAPHLFEPPTAENDFTADSQASKVSKHEITYHPTHSTIIQDLMALGRAIPSINSALQAPGGLLDPAHQPAQRAPLSGQQHFPTGRRIPSHTQAPYSAHLPRSVSAPVSHLGYDQVQAIQQSQSRAVHYRPNQNPSVSTADNSHPSRLLEDSRQYIQRQQAPPRYDGYYQPGLGDYHHL